MHKAIILTVTCVFAVAAHAQQYKWLDQDGKVRYGDVPPPGVNATRLKGPTGGSSPAPAAADPSAAAKKDAKPLTPEEAFRKRQEEASKDRDKQAQAEQQAQAKRQNCTQAREALRSLESGDRIQRTDSKGERYYLEDAGIAKETARARQAVQQWCS
jgi:hypothetical protein